MSGETTETVLTFEYRGQTYELDHLGIAQDEQYGAFAVYCEDEMVGEVWTEAHGILLEHRPPLPSDAELIALAKDVIDLEG